MVMTKLEKHPNLICLKLDTLYQFTLRTLIKVRRMLLLQIIVGRILRLRLKRKLGFLAYQKRKKVSMVKLERHPKLQ